MVVYIDNIVFRERKWFRFFIRLVFIVVFFIYLIMILEIGFGYEYVFFVLVFGVLWL